MRLKQGNGGETTSHGGHLADHWQVGTTSEGGDGRGRDRDSGVRRRRAGGNGLSIRQLRQKSRGHLGLAVGELAHGDSGGGRAVRLGIRELGENGSGGGRRTVGLSVRELSQNAGTLGLAIAGLGSHGSAGDGAGGASGIASNDVHGDGRALRSPVGVVQVVEAAGETLVEDGRSTESDRLVGADGEARGDESTSLGRSIELELVVGGNVGGTALSILHDTILKGDDESAGSTAGSAL